MEDKFLLHPASALLPDWVERCDDLWRRVPGGLTKHQRSYRFDVGLYRFTFRGQIVVIGIATAKTGGLAKRRSDFRRPSDSGRRTLAGKMVYRHRDEIVVEVLITGEDQEARILTSLLRDPMIERHEPLWTSTYGAAKRKR